MDELLVIGDDVHGMPVGDYVSALEERLPDVEVTCARTEAALERALPTASVVTGPRLTAAQIQLATTLELFACSYAGTDHLPLETFEDHGVVVTNAAGVHGPNVAEHVVGSILYFTRRFHVAHRRTRRAEWRHFQARELAGSRVTVVGLGAIGTAVCERLDAFDVEIVGVRNSPEKGGLADTVVGYGDPAVAEALAETDYLVLTCPLTDETRGFVDGDSLQTLPSDAVVVNVARGPVVETDALVAAIRRGRLRGAALDVTDPEPLPASHPLWTLEPVLLTPHNAGHTPRYYDRLAALVARNVRRSERGETLENVVAG